MEFIQLLIGIGQILAVAIIPIIIWFVVLNTKQKG